MVVGPATRRGPTARTGGAISPAPPIVVLLVTLSAGCGSVSPSYKARSGLPPNDAERRVEQAFVAFGVPVVERTLDGRVRSGRFDPREVFAGQVAERVSCGAISDVGRLSSVHPFELEVLATIRSNAVNGTRIELESYGRGRDSRGKDVQCRLSSSAAAALLDAASGAPAEPRRGTERPVGDGIPKSDCR